MPMKHRHCAYCGSNESARERGHVIPDCMYPLALDGRIQRRTVPECQKCKGIWQDAEAHFRNMIAISGAPNDLVLEQWSGPIKRSFGKPSGPKWLDELRSQMVPVETHDGPRHAVYPAKDKKVMLVVRKIIRGLCHYHKLGTSIEDSRVWADVMHYEIPPAFREEMTWHDLDGQFCVYGYSLLNDHEFNIHSAWSLTFYGNREFFAVVRGTAT